MSASTDLDRDVGQLLWFGFAGPEAPPGLLADIAAGRVGAVVLFGRNLPMRVGGEGDEVVDVEALRALIAALHDAGGSDQPPLWVAIDQEGGTVQRVRAPATVWPPMLRFDALAGESEAGARAVVALAEEIGLALGRELAALGVDVDFAPVLDVHTNPQNPVIGARAFGTTPEAVCERAPAFARGLERAGLVSCGKHFPGHGDTDTDSHLALPRLSHDRERLEAVELRPFRAAVAAGLPMIMTAHVVFTAFEPAQGDERGLPATLSRAVITGLLRERMGFEGLIVSDDLDMRAIVDHVGVGEAAVRAIAAGCDVLLLCRDPDHQREAREALCRAGAQDGDMRAAIGRAAGRVRAAKGAHQARRADTPRPGLDVLGCAAHRALARRLAGAGAG